MDLLSPRSCPSQCVQPPRETMSCILQFSARCHACRKGRNYCRACAAEGPPEVLEKIKEVEHGYCAIFGCWEYIDADCLLNKLGRCPKHSNTPLEWRPPNVSKAGKASDPKAAASHEVAKAGSASAPKASGADKGADKAVILTARKSSGHPPSLASGAPPPSLASSVPPPLASSVPPFASSVGPLIHHQAPAVVAGISLRHIASPHAAPVTPPISSPDAANVAPQLAGDTKGSGKGRSAASSSARSRSPASSSSAPPQLDFVENPQLLRPWIASLDMKTLHEVGLAAMQELHRRRT